MFLVSTKTHEANNLGPLQIVEWGSTLEMLNVENVRN